MYSRAVMFESSIMYDAVGRENRLRRVRRVRSCVGRGRGENIVAKWLEPGVVTGGQDG
jgi:hypothetical protein